MNWLKEKLDLNKDKNIIILQHFPLVPPMDKETYFTYHPEEFLSLIEENKNIKATVSGHYGVNSEKEIGSTIHITTAPLPYYRVIDIMDCETPNPSIWTELNQLN